MACNESSDFQQAILMPFSDLQPQVWFSSRSKEQVSRQCMREEMFLFGYQPDLASQSAMKPYHLCSILSSERMHPCLALMISLLISLMVDQVVSLRRGGVNGNFVRAHAPKQCKCQM